MTHTVQLALSRVTLTDSSGHERICFSARRVTQNIMMREATAPMQHHMLSGRWTSSSTIQPMCFRTETPRPRRTTLVSVAELSPLVVVIPTFLASPAVARALRPVAECPALEVVVVADVTEPIIRPPFVSQFPSLATALRGEPESVCVEPLRTNMWITQRQPYAELKVFCANSGAHESNVEEPSPQAPSSRTPFHLGACRPSLGTATRADC